MNQTILLRRAHGKKALKKAGVAVLLIVLILSMAALSLSLGSLKIPYQEVWGILMQLLTQGYDPGQTHQTVILILRLPRVVMGLLAGFGLGAAGAVFQGVLRNPLASPTTLGVSSAAGMGAALAMILGIGITGGKFLVISNAFIFSMVPSLVIFGIARFKQATPEMMILSGIGMLYIFGAITSMLQFLAPQDALKAMVVWLMGDLGRAKWPEIMMTGAILFSCTPLIMWKAWDLNLMSLGDDAARSLGTSPNKSRLFLMVTASLMTATIICFTGMIGFIGLVSPHICRILIGSDNRYLVLASGVFGSAFLIFSDLICRTIMAPVIIPVGIITSCAGGPLFLYLILQKKKRHW